MSLRIFSASISVCLAGCGGPPEGVAPGDPANAVATGGGTPAEGADERIVCWVGGAAMAQDCTVDRTTDGGASVLTIRHPDGGFRRLKIAADGAVTAADGAVPAEVTTRDGIADVTVGDARYRLPLARP